MVRMTQGCALSNVERVELSVVEIDQPSRLDTPLYSRDSQTAATYSSY